MTSLSQNIEDLARARNRTVGMMREILNDADAEGRSLTGVEEGLFATLQERFQQKTGQLEQLRRLEHALGQAAQPSRIEGIIAEIKEQRGLLH